MTLVYPADNTTNVNTYTNVLLIDQSSVPDYQVFADSANAATFPIIYSSTSTKAELLAVLQTKFTVIEKIALVFIGTAPFKLFLEEQPFFTQEIANDPSSSSSTSSTSLPYGDSENTQFLLTVIKDFQVKNIDFLACDTLKFPNWTNYYDFLTKETGVVVGASSDKTGNLKYGGDWIMESTQQDIELVYFRTSIEYYKYLLDQTDHTVIIKDGKLYACGRNDYGQLGDNSLNPNTNFTEMSLPNPTYAVGEFPKYVSCGQSHTVVLTNKGNLYACGWNYSGKLGDGTTTNRSILKSMSLPNPTYSVGEFPQYISCGSYHTVVLTNKGNLYACGYNITGQLGLGDGTLSPRYTLTRISNPTGYVYGEFAQYVSCGEYHTVVLTNYGNLYACGYNYYGQLGIGSSDNNPHLTLTPMLNPTPNYAVGEFAQYVSCGGYHTVVLTNKGNLYACGHNNYGQLGDNTLVDRSTLTPILNPTPNYASSELPQYVSCGDSFTVVLTNKGKLYACGYNNYGQLGIGSSDNNPHLTLTPMLNPTPNYAVGEFAQYVSCGGYHTVVLTNKGNLYACGHNNYGQLGDNTLVDRFTLTPMLNPTPNYAFGELPQYISCGYIHTVVLTNYGNLYSCGLNTNGQYGNGTIISSNVLTKNTTFVNVNYLMENIYSRPRPITAFHTVIIKSDSLYSCGNNSSGQLGNNTLSPSSILTPMVVPTNVPYASDEIPQYVSCGAYHTVVITNKGKLYACGNNSNGQLGNVSTTNSSTLTLSNNTYGNGELPKYVSCGAYHTVVLTTYGNIYACGDNYFGQLGIGDNYDRYNLIQITGFSNNNFTIQYVSCGAFHSVVVTNTGNLYACGDNSYGQLGDGTNISRSTLTLMTLPTFINAGERVQYIYCGQFHTVVLTNKGNLYACGYNDFGQLGDGTNISRSTLTRMLPTFINAGEFPQYVTCGAYHTLVLTNKGNLYGCGDNSFGQLGDGTNISRSTFVLMLKPQYAIDEFPQYVSCGAYHTLVLTNKGNLYTCGDNSYGQLGDGTINPQYTLKLIINSNDVTYIMNTMQSNPPTGYSTIIIKDDGNLYACGDNSQGQLGNGTTNNMTTTLTVMIPPVYDTGEFPQYVSHGLFHTVVLTNKGNLFSCGDNSKGQLGRGNTLDERVLIPMNLPSPPYAVGEIPLYVSCGDFYTVVLTNNGNLYACGDNTKGQLGIGSSDILPHSTLIKITIPNNSIGQYVFCGAYHTVVLTTNGNLYACGDNSKGQLGVGSSDNNTHATLVQMNLPSPPYAVGEIPQYVSCGAYHTVVLTTNGNLYACGDNSKGQLGMNNTTSKTTLSLMQNITDETPQYVSCGAYHTVVLTNTGKLFACGDNSKGQFGDSTTTMRLTWIQMTTPNFPFNSEFPQYVSCDKYHTIILTNYGNVYACGDNSSGQLGDSTFYTRYTLKKIVNGNVASIMDILPFILPIADFFNFANNAFTDYRVTDYSRLEALSACNYANKYARTSTDVTINTLIAVGNIFTLYVNNLTTDVAITALNVLINNVSISTNLKNIIGNAITVIDAAKIYNSSGNTDARTLVQTKAVLVVGNIATIANDPNFSATMAQNAVYNVYRSYPYSMDVLDLCTRTAACVYKSIYYLITQIPPPPTTTTAAPTTTTTAAPTTTTTAAPTTTTTTAAPIISINLNSGWNMIGTSKKALITDPNNIIISQSIQTLIGSAFNFPTDMTLQENKGYWIKCSNNGIITLTPPPPPNAIFSFNSPINNVTIELNSVSGYYILDDNGPQIPFSTLSTTIPLITSNSNLKIFSTDVVNIYCNSCNLTSLNISALPALQILYCQNNPLTTLTFGTANTKLYFLQCNDCSLVSLDVSPLSTLQILYCQNNLLLTTLTFGTANTQLVTLYCNECSLELLNVSALPALESLYCYTNPLTTLTFGPANTALTILDCANCKLVSLNVSALSALESLYCFRHTTLTTLTFGPANTKLVTLYCNGCNLASLDVSDLSALDTLDCYTNPTLNTLTFGVKNTALTIVYCYECNLVSLNVSLLSALDRLYCYMNTISQTAANTIAGQLVAHTTITNGLLQIQNQQNSVILNMNGPNYSTLTSRGWGIS